MVEYFDHTQKAPQPSTDAGTLRISLDGSLPLVPHPRQDPGFFLSKNLPQQHPPPHPPASGQFRSSSSPTGIILANSNCFSDLFHLPICPAPTEPCTNSPHITPSTPPVPLALKVLGIWTQACLSSWLPTSTLLQPFWRTCSPAKRMHFHTFILGWCINRAKQPFLIS